MISGSIVALVTPMDSKGDIDWVSLNRLVDFHLQEGSDAIVVAGTTGECSTLSIEEHLNIVRAVVDQVNKRIPVIAGTGSNSTSETILWSSKAADIGVDACLIVAPYYNKPTQEGLYQHYRTVADSVDIPQIIYNVPGRTACDILPETVERISALANVIGIKDATGDISRGRELLEKAREGFSVYSGDDATAAELMLLGAQGNISVTANIAPRIMAKLSKLARAGESKTARELNLALMPLHRALFIESNPIPVKWALHEKGLIQDGIRLPLTWLDSDSQMILREALSTL
jgi:4-hydroxy-tetrahydrodipicolinate synthase